MSNVNGWYFDTHANPERLVYIARSVGGLHRDRYMSAEFRLDTLMNGRQRFRTALARMDLRPAQREMYQRLAAQNEREIAHIERTLNPPLTSSDPADAPITAPHVTGDAAPLQPAVSESLVVSGQEIPVAVLPEERQVQEDAAHLDALGVPQQLGRPAVREWLKANAPDVRIADNRLAAALVWRRREAAATL